MFAHITVGHYKGQDVSVWELIHSYYFSEERRQEILLKYKSGAFTIDQLIAELINIIKETEEHNFNGTSVSEVDNAKTSMQSEIIDITLGEFKGQKLSVWNLLNSKYVSEDKRKELLEKYTSGNLSIEDIVRTIINIIKETEETLISEQGLPVQSGAVNIQVPSEEEQLNLKDQINRALTFITADITTGEFQGQKKNMWEILHSDSTPSEERHTHLKKHKMTVEEIIKSLVDTIEKNENKAEYTAHDDEIKKALQSITVDVKIGQYRGKEVTVWDLLHSKYITEKQREELLKTYKLTIKEIIYIIMRTIEETEEKRKKITASLKSFTIDVTIGAFKGQKVTVWELLNSKYISEEKRKELLQKLQSGELNEGELIAIIITIIEETEERSSKLKFKGLRRQVTATELLTSEIIDQMTLNELTQGIKTVEEVTQMDQVKRYLEGTSCIAGVFVPSPKDPTKKEKMSIYQAMWKRILRPGTALVLLEAQAATGFIIDPLKNTKLSVDEAVAADVIGQELHAKLLSAEKGVTGYTDPYTGQKISLFQAMNKDLIVQDHGIRLLEAQIATGGIIDPVHSHRVPVEVAYKRGYFDEEMNQILSDPSDDTKGFFDPNTHENLTYMQLLQRCVQDPETGLYMLELVEGVDKNIQTLFQAKLVHLDFGHFQGQDISVWQLLYSQYFTEEKRQEIFRRYKSGKLTIDQLITEVIIIVKAQEAQIGLPGLNVATEAKLNISVNKQEKLQQSIHSQTIDIKLGEFKGQKLSVLDLLHSKYFSSERRKELLEKYNSGAVSIEDICSEISTIIKETEERVLHEQSSEMFTEAGTILQADSKEINRALQFISTKLAAGDFEGQTKTLWELLNSKYTEMEKRRILLEKHRSTVEEIRNVLISAVEESEYENSPNEQIQHSLQSEMLEISVGHYRGKKISVWELLNSKDISEETRKEVLERYRSGKLTLEELITILTATLEISDPSDEHLRKALEDVMVDVLEGKYRGQKVSIWDLLQSEYITEDKRKELLKKCRFSVREIIDMVICIINERGVKLDLNDPLITSQIGEAHSTHREEQTQETMKSTFVEIPVGELKGHKLSLWDILESNYFSQLRKSELLEEFQSGTLSLDELTTTLITIIEKTEARRSMLTFKGLRRQVSAAELLSSEIIDQKTLNELTQGSKTLEEVTQTESVRKYLEGTSCIAGVLVPLKTDVSRKEKMSIHQAMRKNILRPGTALVLLEAQAATGFVIDPLQNRKLSVDDAVAAGVVGRDLHIKLLSAEKAVTGYTDPYTGNTISLFQAMNKDLIVRDHGIRLLEAQIATGGIIDPVHSHRVPVEVAYKRGYFEEEMNQILSDPSDDTKGFFDPNTHENLTYMQLLERCVQDPETGLYMLDIVQKGSSWFQIDKPLQASMQSRLVHVSFGAFHRETASVWDLFFSRFITEEKRQDLLKKYRSGTLSFEQLIVVLTTIISENEGKSNRENMNIAIKKQENKSLHMSKSFNSESENSQKNVNIANEVQKAENTNQLMYVNGNTTVFEGKGQGHSETDNNAKEVRENQIKKTLKYFYVNFTHGPFQGHTPTLWALLRSKHVPEHNKQVLYKKYIMTIEEVIRTITSMIKEREQSSSNSKSTNNEVSLVTDEQRMILQAAYIEVTIGEFSGQKHSVWELLNSKYISVEKLNELMSKYNSGELTLDELIRIITTIIVETEERRSTLKFKGLRRQVTATELLSSEIIDEKTLNELTQGNKTVEEVTQMDSVKRYLEGSNCIAGVLVPSKKDPSLMEKMSIYEAMRKRILRPGTALVLLEAQAATGFMVNPVTNEKLSVDEAVSAGLVGQELHAKLLSAEKAVTGYTDPYTQDKISLFQAMHKDLIVKDHGIRLLEAQIATGGIIDPVHSHRVPVEVAYKRGYFDEEMNQILSDPSDDTKGFFDPNTHENLTYMQLVERGIQDVDSGFCLLSVNRK